MRGEAAKFELVLENGETVSCSRYGHGQRIAFIPGSPGSFYFNGLSALQDEYTFVAHDDIWTYRKVHHLKEKNIDAVTKETIKERDHLIVQALKKHFKVNQIDGFGFSAPGAFLFEEALDYPDDYDRLIGTGIGLIELDPTFSKTDILFFSTASPERKKAFEKYQVDYQRLQQYDENNNSSEIQERLKFFDIKPTSRFPLKPHKQFVAESISLIPKIFFDYADAERTKQAIIMHWKKNPFKEHINKKMQEHFFINIYPRLNSLNAISQLAKNGKPILLLYGSSDFITPISSETMKILKKHPSVQIEIIENSGHMSYLENSKNYAEMVLNFVKSKSVNLQSKL